MGIWLIVLGVFLALVGGAMLYARAGAPPRYAPSDHYDGERFFNPRRASTPRGPQAMLEWQRTRTPAEWPKAVPVIPARPAARVEGSAIVVTVVGHASHLIQTRGLNILTDPVWSERASPVQFAGPRRVREPGIRFADLPKIDLVLVSHGHYDHLDLPTLKRLWKRDRPRIITPLGHQALLRWAGIASEEGDWGDRFDVAPGVAVHIDRVQHWTARGLRDRNRALWSGFTVELPGGNVFFAGDCGYDQSAFTAARAHGPVRVALLPIGAYEPRWFMKAQHMDPAEAVAAFADLGAAHAVGIHWGVFQLTDEAIDAPPAALAAALAHAGVAADRFPALVPGESLVVPAAVRAAAE